MAKCIQARIFLKRRRFNAAFNFFRVAKISNEKDVSVISSRIFVRL
jgi:hypothetical protein